MPQCNHFSSAHFGLDDKNLREARASAERQTGACLTLIIILFIYHEHNDAILRKKVNTFVQMKTQVKSLKCFNLCQMPE